MLSHVCNVQLDVRVRGICMQRRVCPPGEPCTLCGGHMQGGNMDGLWEAPPPGLRMLGDMHMARVLASGLCSPGLHPSSAIDVAPPACPCGGTE